MTPLDKAKELMDAQPESSGARMAFYERVADGELFLVLEEEPKGETVKPALFAVDGRDYALVFDTSERLTEFTQNPTPYLSASGRQITGLLAGQGIGIGLNLAVAPSSTLLPASAIAWLQNTLGAGPEQRQAKPKTILPPGDLPESLIRAFDAKLATMAGLARVAYLCQMEFEGQPKSHVFAFVDALAEAEPAIAAAMAEALKFSGVEAGTLDVIFLPAQNPMAAQLAKTALRFDLPLPEAKQIERVAPGSDPDKPPILR